MGTVTVFTAARMQAIEDAAIVSGLVDINGDLILYRYDDGEVNAGNVVGPQGIQGATGPIGPEGPVGPIGPEGPAGPAGSPPDASTTVKGLVEIATTAEAQAGIDPLKAITPLTLKEHAGVPRAIAGGGYSSSSTLSTGTGVSISRTFPSGRFSSAPRVVANPTKSARIQMACMSITSTGFTARLDNFSGGTAADRDFNWLALEEW